MLHRKLKWYPLFEHVSDLEALFGIRDTVVYRSMFGEVLLARSEGSYFAYRNRCPHQNKPLNDCWIEDAKIVCPFHRYRYSMEDGKGHGMCLERYELRIDEQGVFLGKEGWVLFG